MKKGHIIALIVLAPLLVACKRVVAPSVPKVPPPQEPTQQAGSCFTAEECPRIQLACVPGFERFSDPSNPACACGCRPIKEIGKQPQQPLATPPATNTEPQAPPQRIEEPVTPAPAPQPITYQGRLLAGSVSPVIDFNKADYAKALAAKKNIVLYFYANWCPICKREVPDFYSAFNELRNENLVAFQVNYNDSDTDNDEVALARQFGVAYQHTKVFLKNGERVLKSPESWDKQRYLNEISKAF